MEDHLCFLLFCKISNKKKKIFLEKKFIIEKMNNIVKKLLGLNEDLLTTKEPSKNPDGEYLIFYDLNIDYKYFMLLISFLRTNYLKDSHFEQVQETANILGGFESLDNYIIDFYKKPIIYNPKTPEEDIKNEYLWVLLDFFCNYPHVVDERTNYIENDWYMTGEKLVINGGTLFYGKKKKS